MGGFSSRTFDPTDAGKVDRGEPDVSQINSQARNQYASTSADRLLSLNDYQKLYQGQGSLITKYGVLVDPASLRAVSRDSQGNPDGNDVDGNSISKFYGGDVAVELELRIGLPAKQYEIHNAAAFINGLIAADEKGVVPDYLAQSFARNA